MPMTNYMNPAAGLPDTNIPNNPFYSGYNNALKMNMMQPFMENALQSQQLEQAKQIQSFKESMTPEAIEARKSAFPATIAKNKLSTAQSEATLENLPTQKKVDLAKMNDQILTLQGKPAGELVKTLGQHANTIDQLPPAARAMAWESIFGENGQFAQTHPGWKIPDKYKHYSDDNLQEAKELNMAATMTPELKQKIMIEQEKGKAGVAKQAEANKGRLGAASITAASRIKAAQMQLDMPKNAVLQKLKYMKVLQDPNSPPEARSEAEGILQGLAANEFSNVLKSDPYLQNLQIGALGKEPDSPEVQRLQSYTAQLKQKHLASYGIGNAPKPTSQTYDPGKVYPGATGKYKFKGGDPKNKENWEKVD